MCHESRDSIHLFFRVLIFGFVLLKAISLLLIDYESVYNAYEYSYWYHLSSFILTLITTFSIFTIK